jgi:hypothetical protein
MIIAHVLRGLDDGLTVALCGSSIPGRHDGHLDDEIARRAPGVVSTPMLPEELVLP